MTQYGDTQEPGIITDLTSASIVPTAGEAPTDMGIVGQADLGTGDRQGSADANTVYQVTRAAKAREWFGHEDTSMLTQAILYALNEGAYPVYATAPTAVSVTGEDHSGVTSTSVTLDNGPIREDASSITVTLDGTDLDVNVVYTDPSTYTVADGECYVNPVYSTVELPSTPSNSLTVDYEHFDYSSAHDAMAQDGGEVIDFFTPLSERSEVVTDAKNTVAKMEDDYELAVLQAGADIHIPKDGISDYTNPFDDSRTQLVYPTRFADGSSALAAYAGRKAALGIETTAINKRLNTNKSLMFDLKRSKRSLLISENVVPLADEAQGVRITDDPTCVTQDNNDEKNLKYGFNRLVMDYIIQTVRVNERPFIGRLNNPAVRNTLVNLIRTELNRLSQSGMVLSYSVNIQPVDATTAALEVSVDLAEPLRFIENTVTVGQGSA